MQEEISFGVWLRKQRRALDLSRQAFADQIGCAQVTLRRIEGGSLKPSKELAGIILEKLAIPEAERSQWISFARGLSGFPSQSPTPLNKPKSNLPAQLTTFIGREKEQAQVINLISKHRLLTLTGSGGIGKTRLAIKVGEQVLGDYPDGVWLVELAPILDPSLVPHTTALTLGLREDPKRRIIDMLCDYLRQKKMLLLLDNCEHALDACSQMTDAVLKTCPQLKIFATSREPLNITGEAVYRVPSLRLPNLEQILDTFRNYESIQLFEERAQLVQFDFSLTLENAASVAQICQRLDGIPLAIELAAAKVAVFSTEQIAKQLHESFHLLAEGSRTALPRQQTLRASINWSWNLLSESEQRLMRQISVFAGGWTLEAAQSVCDGDVLELTNSLMKKSLVVMNWQTETNSRYAFHEVVRQYAYEKLIEMEEEEKIQGKHLEYFMKLSEQIEQELVGPQELKWFIRTNDELNNLRAALEHALLTNVEAGLYIASRLGEFWLNFDSHEGTHWLDAFLRKRESREYPHARAKALYTQSQFYISFYQYKDAQDIAEESLALFRSLEDRYGQVDSLISVGATYMFGPMADTIKAVELAEQALISARSLGDIRRQASALSLLGWDHRDHKSALKHWKKSVTLCRQIGQRSALANALSKLGSHLLLDGQLDAAQQCLGEANFLFHQLNIRTRSTRRHLLTGLGQVALMKGDYEQARNYFREIIRISNELGDQIDYQWTMIRLGSTELLAGNITEARQIFIERVQNFQKNGIRIGVAFTLEGMSRLYASLGKAEVAARLIGWIDETLKEIGNRRPKLEQGDVDKIIEACVTRLGEDAFSDAYEEGKKMSLDEAVSLALEEN